jgi:ATP-binding cassette subfamily B protein
MLERLRPRFLNDSLLWRLLSESLPEHKGKYAVAAAAMIMVAATTALSAWIMGEIIDTMSDTQHPGRVYLVATGVVVIFVVKGLASFAQAVLMARAGNRIVAEKQVQLFKRLLLQGIGFFNTNESSDLLMRVTQSAQMARGVIDTIMTAFVRDLLTLLSLMAVMIYQQPMLSLVSLMVGPASLYGVRLILARVRLVMAQEMEGLAEIIKVVQESSTGARVVKAFSLEDVMARRMEAAVRSVENRSNKMVRLEAATSPLMDTITGVAIAAIVVFSHVHIFGESAGSPGQLMSFVTAFLMAYEPAKRLSRMSVSIEGGMVGVRMMYSLLDQPVSVVDAPGAKDLQVEGGTIALDNVTFSYGGGKGVLRDLSVIFPAGKMTALVGPSGGGKSTLVNLLLRLYDPDSGTVSIDGQDIKQAKIASVRKNIAFVGQDTFLFSASVMDNIRMARPDASDEDVIDAAKIAHAHEFIDDLALSYATQIGENGAFLSGGQRQRLSIARAVLRNAPILLLDEATSALDSHSELLVRDALGRVCAGVTTIIIAHRLPTILNADNICYVEGGKVVEQGSLAELLMQNKKFSALYKAQFGSQNAG